MARQYDFSSIIAIQF